MLLYDGKCVCVYVCVYILYIYRRYIYYTNTDARCYLRVEPLHIDCILFFIIILDYNYYFFDFIVYFVK